jgi:hypothetical protein
LLDVAVCPAHRTKALAIRPAYHLHGDGQEDLLPHYVVQVHSIARKKADHQFIFSDFHFLFQGDLFHRPVREIEIVLNRYPHLLQAPVAGGLQHSGNMAVDPDFLPGQFGFGVHRKRFCLPELYLSEIQGAGPVSFGYLYPVKFQFLEGDEHFGLTRPKYQL